MLRADSSSILPVLVNRSISTSPSSRKSISQLAWQCQAKRYGSFSVIRQLEVDPPALQIPDHRQQLVESIHIHLLNLLSVRSFRIVRKPASRLGSLVDFFPFQVEDGSQPGIPRSSARSGSWPVSGTESRPPINRRICACSTALPIESRGLGSQKYPKERGGATRRMEIACKRFKE